MSGVSIFTRQYVGPSALARYSRHAFLCYVSLQLISCIDTEFWSDTLPAKVVFAPHSGVFLARTQVQSNRFKEAIYV
ncbi:MAG: hypothetical protein ACI81P_001005 [Neolewinella sp.]|jgi:hypothetical protein